MVNLGDFLKSINSTKEDVFKSTKSINEFNEVESQYVPYVVNKCLSYFIDTIFLVEELNRRPNIPKYNQYKFLLDMVRKRSRFKKWDKIDDIDSIKLVREYYNYGHDKAVEVLKIITKEQLNEIKKELENRGK